MRKYKTQSICLLQSMAIKHTHQCSTVFGQRCIYMYLGAVHPSFDNPPTSTMFNRAGSGGPKKKTAHLKLQQQLETWRMLFHPSWCHQVWEAHPDVVLPRSLITVESVINNSQMLKIVWVRYTDRSVILGMLKKLVYVRLSWSIPNYLKLHTCTIIKVLSGLLQYRVK